MKPAVLVLATLTLTLACSSPGPGAAANGASTASGPSDPVSANPRPPDKQVIAQAALDVPGLQQYFHIETRPDRKPLKVVVNDAVDPSWQLSKFGEPVVYVDETTIGEQPHIVFKLVRIEGDKAAAQLRYPIEGIVLHAEFRRAGGAWKMVDHELAEE